MKLCLQEAPRKTRLGQASRRLSSYISKRTRLARQSPGSAEYLLRQNSCDHIYEHKHICNSRADLLQTHANEQQGGQHRIATHLPPAQIRGPPIDQTSRNRNTCAAGKTRAHSTREDPHAFTRSQKTRWSALEAPALLYAFAARASPPSPAAAS